MNTNQQGQVLSNCTFTTALNSESSTIIDENFMKSTKQVLLVFDYMRLILQLIVVDVRMYNEEVKNLA